jgi:hypothetical protein
MELDLPLYALQRSGSGRWLPRTFCDNPFTPAVLSVAVFDEPDYSGAEKQRGGQVIRLHPNTTRIRGETNNLDFRTDLLEVARLLDHLAPDIRDPERFHVQIELRRLAKNGCIVVSQCRPP